MPVSPTLEGFRVAFRKPLLTLAEISWRWVVGASAIALFFFGLIEYLRTLPVSGGELLFLRSRQPFLVAQAVAHILRGSLIRAVMSVVVAALAIDLLWMIAAAVGRIATVEWLLDYFRGRNTSPENAVSAGEPDTASNVSTNQSLFAIVRLNFLRISVVVAAILGFVGASILASLVSPDAHPRPGLAFLVFLPIAGLICVAGCALNWLLSLAGMFAVRERDDALGAISSAVTLCRERIGAVVAVSAWTGLAHLVAFFGATTIISMALAFVPLLPWRLVLLLMLLVTLVYFAVADWLYMARLAGYVFIVETPGLPVAAPLPPVAPPADVYHTSIDRDELILSDIPNPVTG